MDDLYPVSLPYGLSTLHRQIRTTGQHVALPLVNRPRWWVPTLEQLNTSSSNNLTDFKISRSKSKNTGIVLGRDRIASKSAQDNHQSRRSLVKMKMKAEGSKDRDATECISLLDSDNDDEAVNNEVKEIENRTAQSGYSLSTSSTDFNKYKNKKVSKSLSAPNAMRNDRRFAVKRKGTTGLKSRAFRAPRQAQPPGIDMEGSIEYIGKRKEWNKFAKNQYGFRVKIENFELKGRHKSIAAAPHPSPHPRSPESPGPKARGQTAPAPSQRKRKLSYTECSVRPSTDESLQVSRPNLVKRPRIQSKPDVLRMPTNMTSPAGTCDLTTGVSRPDTIPSNNPHNPLLFDHCIRTQETMVAEQICLQDLRFADIQDPSIRHNVARLVKISPNVSVRQIYNLLIRNGGNYEFTLQTLCECNYRGQIQLEANAQDDESDDSPPVNRHHDRPNPSNQSRGKSYCHTQAISESIDVSDPHIIKKEGVKMEQELDLSFLEFDNDVPEERYDSRFAWSRYQSPVKPAKEPKKGSKPKPKSRVTESMPSLKAKALREKVSYKAPPKESSLETGNGIKSPKAKVSQRAPAEKSTLTTTSKKETAKATVANICRKRDKVSQKHAAFTPTARRRSRTSVAREFLESDDDPFDAWSESFHASSSGTDTVPDPNEENSAYDSDELEYV
ncbi:hypothetical protein B0J11DRAFT_603934 [Dendryphion nanum]|uniref:Uncharacterized protein n=1 Tax=Dendryphion nanum TaxID=256645 RepID=A0A9P9E032_9PLEO|nr:hypothetical protein B0J11DRAFT_603934 [Dendryphion nanum]